MSKEQNTLKIFSNIELVIGILNVAVAVLLFVGGGAALGNAPSIVEEGLASAEDMSTFGNVAFGVGLASLASGVVCFLNWHFLKKVAMDATQYKGAWIVSIIGVILALIGLIMNITGQRSNFGSNIVSLLVNAFVVYLVYKVRSTVE